MSEKSRFIAILGAVLAAILIAIILAVVVGREKEPVQNARDELVVGVRAQARSGDSTTSTDEPEKVAEEVDVEIGSTPEPAKEEPKPEPVIAPRTEPKAVVDDIEEVMAALEYRDEFCPSGFQVRANPGYMPEKSLPLVAARLGVPNSYIRRCYRCEFSSERRQSGMSYLVFELTGRREAVALQEAFTAKASQLPNRGGDTFLIRNCVVVTGFNSDSENGASELMRNLKKAVNYKESGSAG